MSGIEGSTAEAANVNVQQAELQGGYILGFRAWKAEANPHLRHLYEGSQGELSYPHILDYQPLFLKAVWAQDFWPEAKKEGHCETRYDNFWEGTSGVDTLENRVPHSNCECGLYSCYSLKGLLRIKKSVDNREALIFGLVIGSGKVQIHLDGFRAEHMRIVALIKNPYALLNPDYLFNLQDISKRYGIALIDIKGVPKVVQKLGGTYDVNAQSVGTTTSSSGGPVGGGVLAPGSALPGPSAIKMHNRSAALFNVPDRVAAWITSGVIVAFFAFFVIAAMNGFFGKYQAPVTPPGLDVISSQINAPTIGSNQLSEIDLVIKNSSNSAAHIIINNYGNPLGAVYWLDNNNFIPPNALSANNTSLCSIVNSNPTSLDCGALPPGQTAKFSLQGHPVNAGKFNYFLTIQDSNGAGDSLNAPKIMLKQNVTVGTPSPTATPALVPVK